MKPTAAEIIEGLRLKDPAIFRYLYREYSGLIAGHVRKNSGTLEDAREIIQITLVELWNAVQEDRYQEQGKLDRYIYQLAANNWRYELRRRRNNPQTVLGDVHTAMHDDSDQHLAFAVVKDRSLNALHRALSILEQPCRDIIQRYHLQEENLIDMAQQLAYDYNNLRKRIFDCRKKLKRITEEILGRHEK